jgi:DNA-binding MarR family transcriptional regulator
MAALTILELHGPLRPGDLATRMAVTAASMSRLTEVLEREGWVTRGPDPADRRACLLSLNDHGRTALEELRREGVTELVAGITTLTGDEQAALQAALPILTALANRHPDKAHDPGGSADDRPTDTPAARRPPPPHFTGRGGSGA